MLRYCVTLTVHSHLGIRRGEDPIIAGIEEKIAEWTHVPPEYGEAMQILRYFDGQEYAAHVSEAVLPWMAGLVSR